MPTLARAGLAFHFRDSATGPAVVFQHGLGGDVAQADELLAPLPGMRLVALDCRGHGQTRPTGDEAALRFAIMADDLVALLDHLRIEAAIVGGVSMGAALALHFALRFPGRTRALVLVRPAWTDGVIPPERRRHYSQVAECIRRHGAQAGRDAYRHSSAFQALQTEAPEAAQSMLRQFESPRAEDAVARLERLPADVPHGDRAAWQRLQVPSLVLASHTDWLHPQECAVDLAAGLPGAQLETITPKAANPAQHRAGVRAAALQFFIHHHLTEA